MNDICFIVLNYKDESRVNELSKKILGFNQNYKVIVVDNESTEESFFKLKIENNNFYILRSEKNLGYTGGHNLAFKYVLDNRLADYIFVVNSDVDFEKDLIDAAVEALDKNPSYGLISARMIEYGIEKNCCWHLPTYRQYINQTFWYLKGLPRLVIPYQIDTSEELMKVDVIRGSLQVYRFDALTCVKCYDEKCFMYNFENIMSTNLKDNGYEVGLLTRHFYLHNHPNRKDSNEWKRQRILINDSIYYLREVMKVKPSLVLMYTIIGNFNYFLLSLKKRLIK